MKKVKYITPEMSVLELAPRQIICTSGYDINSLDNNIDLDYEGETTDDIDIR